MHLEPNALVVVANREHQPKIARTRASRAGNDWARQHRCSMTGVTHDRSLANASDNPT